MHAIATIVAELRDHASERALVWANGGYLTKHSFGVYAAAPPTEFRHDQPQSAIDRLPAREVAENPDATAATIEAYTVMHDRDGAPQFAIAACTLPDGRRTWATSGEADTTTALTEGEWVGSAVHLESNGALHV